MRKILIQAANSRGKLQRVSTFEDRMSLDVYFVSDDGIRKATVEIWIKNGVLKIADGKSIDFSTAIMPTSESASKLSPA